MKQKKLLLMLESQIDKIVLAVFVIISLALLWLYVIGNPYGQKVRIGGRERKLSPSQIDRSVKQELEEAIPRLENPAPPPPPPPTYWPKYDRLVQCPISDISSSLKIPVPGEGEEVILAERTYVVPEIPSLTNVSVEPLRGAAQVPTDEIGPERPYESAPHELADVDLVSVSARFDIQRLINNFQQSFMGPRLTSAEKDSRLAEPVFARMELQRRTQRSDGQWGDWEVVSRTQIDAYQKLLEDLPVQLQESQYGVDVWMSQFGNQKVQHDILQPEPYAFTISRLDWMAPEFLTQAQEIIEKEEEQARREAMESRRRERDQSTRQDDTRRTRDRRTSSRRDSSRGRDNQMMFPGMQDNRMESERPARSAARREKTIEDIQKEYEKELLDEKKDVTLIQEPLLVWAHDDTAQPGNAYQYRIRIGVFNPIAGKDWFHEDQVKHKEQIILWSNYSEPTAVVEIPKRVYMFPMEVIAGDNGSDEVVGVRVQVAKYFLGQWRDYDFDVYPGQIIGYEVEDDDEDDDNAMTGDYQSQFSGRQEDLETVDFTTGFMLVDIFNEIVWGSRLRPSSLETMLYHDTDNQLRQMVVGKTNWHSDVRDNYDMIQKAMEAGVNRRSPGMRSPMPGVEMMPGMMPGMPGMPGMPQ